MLPIFLFLFVVLFVVLKTKRNTLKSWNKQHVVIVGGAGTLGHAITAISRKRGARVTVLDLLKDGKNSKDVLECDATDAKKVDDVFSSLQDATILINTQGIMNSGQNLIDQTPENIQRSLSINLLSFLYTTRGFLKYSTHPLYIVNVTSCLGLGGVACLTDYCAGKFGVFGFSEALRNELRPKGIKVLTVCPFLLQDSPMFKGKVRIKYPFLTTPLETTDVAEAIIKALETGKSELWMPWWVNLMGLMRLLPTNLFDQIQDILGSSNSFIK